VRANLSIYIGDIEACLRDARVFVELAERSGSTWALAVSASTLGRAYLTGQRWSQGRESLDYALAQARQHKLGLEAEASYLALLAEALAGTGELEKALATAEEAVKMACRKKTRFWELQAQIVLAGILLRREQIKDRPRIAKALSRAEELIEKTGGEVMKPFVVERQAEFAKLNGDGAGHQRMLKEAHRLFISMEAHGYAERLAAKLRNLDSSSGAPEVET
jgi:tetratricopeptide (TPR) repeat protein